MSLNTPAYYNPGARVLSSNEATLNKTALDCFKSEAYSREKLKMLDTRVKDIARSRVEAHIEDRKYI